MQEQTHVADVLRDYRQRLERARKDLDPELNERGIPRNPIAARMLEVEGRMLDLEHFILDDVEKQEQLAEQLAASARPLQLRAPLRARPRHWTQPRIGMLRHHPPTRLRVPTSYFTTDAPSPAPAISIVTPSFQQGRFLARTIYSVINQNYPALEYVVQDGGSTDATLDVLRRYERSLTHWASEPDGGQGDAINRGFAHTTGEIMAYLNSDDLLLPGSLAYVASYLVDHPDVDVVYGQRVMIDDSDRQIGSWVLPPHDEHELRLVDFVPQETLFWRRSAWEAAGGRIDSSLGFAIDWDLLLRLADSGAKMVRLPRFLGAFRVHDEQKTAVHDDLYHAECDQLRRRVHGRAMSHDEAVARARPYMRRHIAYHTWYRLKERLPASRSAVRTEPVEPWFKVPAAEASGAAGAR